jgi:L-alanine-DL-glutamate epimerase-like enolase superfamily enzyme
MRKMKITDIKVDRYNLSLKKPFKIALGEIKDAKNVLVRVFCDELVGVGEGAPSPLITGDNQEGCLSFIDAIAPALRGEEPNLQVLEEKTSYIKGVPAAKAALDIAIYDLIGKYFSEPLCRILGGYRKEYRNEIETDITIGIGSPEIVEKLAMEAASEGYGIIKIKAEGDIKADLEKVELLDSMGFKIRVDANQGFTPKDAVRFIKKLSNFNVEFIEQPVAAWDIDALKYVRENSEIPVIADESVHSARDALLVVKHDAVDGINIKLMKCGGISEAIKIIHVAESAGIPCMIGCMLESRVSLTAAAHLAFAFKNIKYVDLDSHLFLRDDPVKGGIEVKDGKISLPDEPGLGIEAIGRVGKV